MWQRLVEGRFASSQTRRIGDKTWTNWTPHRLSNRADASIALNIMFELVWMLPDVLLVMAVHGIEVNVPLLNGNATTPVILIQSRSVLHLQVAGRSPPRGRLHGRGEFLVAAHLLQHLAHYPHGRDSPSHHRNLPLPPARRNAVLVCGHGLCGVPYCQRSPLILHHIFPI